MASAFGHAFMAFGLSKTGLVKPNEIKLLFAGILFSILPDADSIGYFMGVPYASMFGHRGFSHSIFFAFLISIPVAFYFSRQIPAIGFVRSFLYLLLSALSHSILDAMTTGGLGVAFFAPFSGKRYFFPFHPIKVSPIGISSFFSRGGLAVIKSEALWIGLPVLSVWGIRKLILKQRVNWDASKES